MSGKTSYAVLISFMALFAIAAHAGQAASAQYSAVMAAVRSNNHDAMRAALDRYSARLSVEFAPKKKVAKALPLKANAKAIAAVSKKKKSVGRSIASVSHPMSQPLENNSIAYAQEMGQPIAPVGQPLGQPLTNDAVASAIAQPLSDNYNACMKSGPADCCAVINDPTAKMPDHCGNRSAAGASGDAVADAVATASSTTAH